MDQKIVGEVMNMLKKIYQTHHFWFYFENKNVFNTTASCHIRQTLLQNICSTDSCTSARCDIFYLANELLNLLHF